MIKIKQTRALHVLKSPVDGVVQQLTVHTIGGVVTPAATLMTIVPETSRLEIEAYVENRDIGFVEVGQLVEVKVDAFPFTRHGVLNGEIIHLSNDAIVDENHGLVFKARIRLKRKYISVNNKPVSLSPGMSVVAEVKTGDRKLIDFFLSPLLRAKNESIRER